MRLIDAQYIRTPFYGSRRITAWLRCQGYPVNRKRVQRLMRRMGIEGIGPKPGTSQQAHEHPVYPYLLAEYPITAPNQRCIRHHEVHTTKPGLNLFFQKSGLDIGVHYTSWWRLSTAN